MIFPADIDVAIVGAGPAGSSAARALAAAGVTTAILEKTAFPRYKTCGGGILFRAAKLLEPGSWQSTIEHSAHHVQLNLLNTQTQFSITRDVPLISMTMRSAFDHALIRQAQHAGAQMFDHCPVRAFEDHGNFVTLATDRGNLRAQFVIGADGVAGIVAKAGGWGPLPRIVPAVEWEVHVPAQDFSRLSQTARFDFDLPPHGYAWVFPKRDHLSIGVLNTHHHPRNLNTDCQTYLKHLGIQETLAITRHGYVIPVQPRPEGPTRGRLLLTGDAAGLADPITAEGITYAIRSGQLAAQAILDARLHPAKTRRLYTQSLQAEILSELHYARILARLLYTPRTRTWILNRHGQRVAELMADIMAGQRTYAEAFCRPANYLKLLRST